VALGFIYCVGFFFGFWASFISSNLQTLTLSLCSLRQVDLDSELWRAVREITVGLPNTGKASGDPTSYQTGLLPTEEDRIPSEPEGV
jgi:hypothetical protein